MKIMKCPHCDYENNHLIGILEIEADDHYQTIRVIVNNEYSIPVKTKYEYRSQGNIHLLFRCESGHYFIKSFDGHKGSVFIDENHLMRKLEKHFNIVAVNADIGHFQLLGEIEKCIQIIETK